MGSEMCIRDSMYSTPPHGRYTTTHRANRRQWRERHGRIRPTLLFTREYTQLCSLGGVTDEVIGENVVRATHGQPGAVFIVLEGVVGHAGIENFHQRHSSVAVVVDVVSFNQNNRNRK